MSGRPLERLYDRLSAHERLRLCLAALARHDRHDMQRLADACPGGQARQYGDLWDAARTAALLVRASWLEAWADYDHIDMTLKLFHTTLKTLATAWAEGANTAWKRAGRRRPFLDYDGRWPTKQELEAVGGAAATDAIPDRGLAIKHFRAMRLRAVHQGALRFAETVGVDPDLLFAHTPPFDDVGDPVRALLAEGPVDDQHATLIEAALHTVWPGLDRSDLALRGMRGEIRPKTEEEQLAEWGVGDWRESEHERQLNAQEDEEPG